MGLFSRLKKAFSLPESDDAQTTSAASEAPATTSQANAPVSDDRALRHNSQLARRAQQLNQLRHRCPVQP